MLMLNVALVFFLPLVTSNMARIYISPQQLLTSSTLAWHPPGDTNHNKVNVGEGTVPWCRVKQHGLWVTGGVYHGYCVAPFLSTTVKSPVTQVLISLNGFARFEPVYWDRLEAFPDNLVSSGNFLLAYKEDEQYGFLPGYVDPKKRKGYFVKRNHIIKNDSAILLVEKEPTKYILRNIVYIKEPNVEVTEKMVGEFKLENPSRSQKIVTKTISFTAAHTTYYGRVLGTLTGVPTVVRSPHGGVMEIIWNRINEMDKNRTYEISRLLPPRSYVEASVYVSVRFLEVAYSAELTAIFPDAIIRTRNISAPHSETRMAELKGSFAGPFNLDNGMPLVRQRHSVEILLHSSTTTTTPSTPLSDKDMLDLFKDSKYEADPDAACTNSATMFILLFSICISFLLL